MLDLISLLQLTHNLAIVVKEDFFLLQLCYVRTLLRNKSTTRIIVKTLEYLFTTSITYFVLKKKQQQKKLTAFKLEQKNS